VYEGIDTFKLKGGLESSSRVFKFKSPSTQTKEKNWAKQVESEMAEPVLMGICCGSSMGRNTATGAQQWEALFNTTETNAKLEKRNAPDISQLSSTDNSVLSGLSGYVPSELPVSPLTIAVIVLLLGFACCANAWFTMAPKQKQQQGAGISTTKGGYSSVPGPSDGGGGTLGGYQNAPGAHC
jgi:hypothetical protein